MSNKLSSYLYEFTEKYDIPRIAKNYFVNLKVSPTDKLARTLYRLIVYYLYSFVCLEWAEFYNMIF